jgi:hypothetical protein
MENAATLDRLSLPEERVSMVAPREKAVEVERLVFTLPMVLALAGAIALGAFSMGAMQYFWQHSDREDAAEAQKAVLKMQSDIRSISERIDSQKEINDANKRADTAERASQIQSYESTKQSVDTMRSAVTLLQLQVAELIKQQKR